MKAQAPQDTIGMAKMRKGYHIRLTGDFGQLSCIEARITKVFPYLGRWGVAFKGQYGLEGNIVTDGTLQIRTSALDSYDEVIDLKGGRYKFEWWVEEDPDIGYPIHF